MLVYTILFYTFIATVCVQIVYYSGIFSKFAFAKYIKPSKKNIGVSVLVCARNESKNLKEFIPKILQQKYSKFEVILINDASTDNSLDVMHSFEANHDNIKVVDVKQNDTFLSSKKYALTLGIKASTYDFLLCTDADCYPTTNQWIHSISCHFSNSKAIVIGFGAYKKIKGSFLNMLIRFETLMTAVQYFSYANLGLPYMAVGRNLGYRKDTFFNAKGFTNHMQIQSGDDDLFVNEVGTKDNTAICFSKESFTESLPHTEFKKWFNQKKRHVSTATFYKPIHKIMLGLFYVSQISFWFLAVALLITLFQWKIVLLLILLRFLAMYLSLTVSAKKLNSRDTLFLLPILDLFLVLMQLVIFISNLTTKKQHWR